jgi:hypothetical protein
MLGVHMPKNVDITGFPLFLPHPSGFVDWVFIGCSRHFEHRVFTGVFMGIHWSAGVQMHIKMISVKVVKNAYQRPYSTIPVPLARNGTVVEVIRIRHSVYIRENRK